MRQSKKSAGISVRTNWRICPSVLPEMAVTRSAGDVPVGASTKFGFADKLDSGLKVGVTEIGGVGAHESAQGGMGRHTHAVRPGGTETRLGFVAEGMSRSQYMLPRR